MNNPHLSSKCMTEVTLGQCYGAFKEAFWIKEVKSYLRNFLHLWIHCYDLVHPNFFLCKNMFSVRAINNTTVVGTTYEIFLNYQQIPRIPSKLISQKKLASPWPKTKDIVKTHEFTKWRCYLNKFFFSIWKSIHLSLNC